jgi:exonuclease III
LNQTEPKRPTFILSLNIQGIKSCFFEFQLSISDLKPIVVILCEHFLSSLKYNLLNTISGYKLAAFYGREGKRQGGVCIIVKDGYTFSERNDINKLSVQSVFECAAIELSLHCNSGIRSFIIIALYRAPSSKPADFLYSIDKLLGKIKNELSTKHVFIGGDFNFDLMEGAKDNKYKDEFYDLVTSHCLNFTFFEATRVTTTTSSCIDNVLSSLNPKMLISRVVDLQLSDHMALLVCLKNDFFRKESAYITSRPVNTDRINYFLQLLKSVSWDSCFRAQSCEDSFNTFFFHFHQAFKSAFPKKNY